ncbi:ABC transporter ATP-binding protein/permease [Paracoccaceae bacterium]|nr:ABC transporter ATP-binding protein/permease [Paracoccaceae bacterium]
MDRIVFLVHIMMNNYFRKVLSLLAPSQRKQLPVLILSFIGLSVLDLIGIGLIGPYVAIVIDGDVLNGRLGSIVDSIGLDRDKKVVLTFFGCCLVGVFSIKTVSAIWINKRIIMFGQEQQIFLRSTLMEAYQALSYSDYLKRNSSEYIYTLRELAGKVQAVTIVILRVLSDGFVALFIISMLAFQNVMALIFLVGLLGIAIILYDRFFRNKMKRYGKEANSAATIMVQGINEGIEGLKEIRILGKESYFHDLVARAAKKLAYFQTQEMVIYTAPRFFMEFLMIIFIVALVLGTLYMGQSLKLLIPTLAMFGVAALRLLPIANTISSSLASIRFHTDAISRLYSEILKFSQFKTFNKTKIISSTKKPFVKIALDSVSFRYPELSQDTINKVSLEIKSGEAIGLIGPSGSGKSTLVDILLGLLEPYDGKVLYNSKILQGSLNEWRSHVAYLPQQVFLLDDSLRQNIALGCEYGEIDDAMVNDALRRARLTDLVEQLPNGLNTELGERGVRLSGGQRQRVALARAFYHERSILVMDEATSALDNETENEIINEIRQLKGEKTMIIIAHRLSTVADCDRIYRLDMGNIIEQGSPDKILRKQAE